MKIFDIIYHIVWCAKERGLPQKFHSRRSFEDYQEIVILGVKLTVTYHLPRMVLGILSEIVVSHILISNT